MTDHKPQFSVVIPVRNGSRFIGEQLDALMNQDVGSDWEIVIADNGSTDDTLALVSRHPIGTKVDVHIADASDTPGVNHARNTGVSRASSDLVLFCDCDDRVRSGWASAHMAALSSTSLGISAGPLVVDAINSARAQRHSRGLTKPTEWHGLAWGWGANFGMHRRVWEMSGPFREDLQGGFDDVEFMIRAQRFGASFQWADEAIVDYRLPATRMKAARRFYSHGLMRVRIAHILPDVLAMPGVSSLARRKRATTVVQSIETPGVRTDRTERIGYSLGVIVGWMKHRLHSSGIRRRPS